jgi:2-polyprenyl-3-methyl-5-hydroxy-6-metoxy-1,4-benzoquinol methylase
MTKDYLYEDRCYRDVHRDGKPYYQHEEGDACDPDLTRLFSWESFPRAGDRILELGCGDGFVTIALAAMGLSVTGVDCSSAAISRARENLTRAGRAAVLHVGDACDLDFLGSGSWDSVLDSHCLHCITDYGDRQRFLGECRRVMSPSGRLFLATMGEQSMEWTRTIDRSPWRRERKTAFHVDERGCYVESLVPPETSERVNARIFVREEVLREEVDTAGLAVTRFERFAPPSDPDDITLLVEVRKRQV